MHPLLRGTRGEKRGEKSGKYCGRNLFFGNRKLSSSIRDGEVF